MACLTWSNRGGRLHLGSLSLPSWRFSPWGYGLLMKIREHIRIFRATLASARCSDPHPRNSLLKVPSRMETPAAELDLFTSRSSFFFPRCEDPDELLCQLDTSLSSGALGWEPVTHGWLMCSAALLSPSPLLSSLRPCKVTCPVVAPVSLHAMGPAPPAHRATALCRISLGTREQVVVEIHLGPGSVRTMRTSSR